MKEDVDHVAPCVLKAGDKIFANKKDSERRNIYKMDNYEKYQNKIIDMIIDDIDMCEELLKIKSHNPHAECPTKEFDDEVCISCARSIISWLLRDADKIDWETIESGTKIDMTRKDTKKRFTSTVIHRDKDYIWLRCENDFPYEDENVLMYIPELEERFEDFKVIKND